MNDLFIFGIGCIVTVMVGTAVGLLVWVTANEPRGELLPDGEATGREAREPGPLPSRGSGAERLAG